MSKITAEEIYQSIMDLYGNADGFERWKAYRERLTDYIISKMDSGKSVAILGVGESNDLDLQRICQHAGVVTLVDKDLESMERALQKYGLEGTSKIKLVKQDFIGITKEEYIQAIEVVRRDIVKLQNMFSPIASGPKYTKEIEKIFNGVNSREVSLGIDEHDYIISIGVHSQLFNFLEWAWSILLDVVQRKNSAYKAVEKMIDEQNTLYMPRFNDALMTKTKERAFIGLEFKEVERDSFPQGALQAIRDLLKKNNDEDSVCYQDIWPYRDGLTYLMHTYVVDKDRYRFG